MTVYYFLIFALMGLGYVLTEKKKENKLTICYLAVSFFVFTFIASFRYAIGFDYFSYQEIYERVAEWTFGDIFSFYWYEPFFFLLCKCFSLFGCSFSGFLWGINAFLFLAAVWFIYRESRMPWISVGLYIMLQFFAYNMNLIRQSIAVAFFLIAYSDLKNQRMLRFSIWIGLGGLFHNSLLFLYPFYFLLVKKNSWKFFAGAGAAAVVVYFLCDSIMEVILPWFPQRYADYQRTYFWKGNGFEYVIPALGYGVLIYGFRNRVRDSVKRAIYLNSAFYNFLINLFIMKHFILERFSIYFFAVSLTAIPEIIDSYREEGKQNKMLGNHYYRVIGVFFIFGMGYFLFAVSKGFHHVYPYVSFLRRSYSVPK